MNINDRQAISVDINHLNDPMLLLFTVL